MTSLHHFSDRWLAWMLAASWQLALFVIVVTLIAWAARGATPRFRHALWLLVLVKALLPPALTAPWSIGQWVPAPLSATAALPSAIVHGDARDSQILLTEVNTPPRQTSISPSYLLPIWGAGLLVFWTAIGWR